MKITEACLAFALVSAGAGFFPACSAVNEQNPNEFGQGGRGNAGGGGGGGGRAAGGGGSGGDSLCQGDDCGPPACPDGSPTSVSGTVVAPTPPQYGAADPIYNAIVFIPTAPVEPFSAGVSCDQCGTPVSGAPAAVALTDAAGHFTLKDVQAGTNVPFVVQIGRWRRQVVVPRITACQDTPLPLDLTRLPRNKAEGDIPLFAIASSPYDAEECILRKIGIDDSEFTAPGQDGRVHLYTGDGASIPGAPSQEALWSNEETLKRYDIVMFPCNALPLDEQRASTNVFNYANAGGRVFATDLSYPWFKDGPPAFQGTAQWTEWRDIGVDPLPALVDDSFPKGAALVEWLDTVGATTTPGHIGLLETYHVVDRVNPPSTRWLYSLNPATVQMFSFNTPVGSQPEQQCGRAVYSNFHIATSVSSNAEFPGECSGAPLTPQEKVLEFLLFDLASCVQDDTGEPQPPPR